MYRSDLNNRDKGGALAGVIAIHAGLAFALLHMSGTIDVTDPQRTLEVFDITEIRPPPPPPPPPPQQKAERPKPKEEEGGSSPNIKSEATPIVAPKPRIPIQSPVAVSETPAQGTAPTQGAAPVRGPGTGTGGTGTGTGTGSGAGAGGGDGGYVEAPRLLTPVLRGRDFPRPLLDMWPRGAQVFMRFRIDAGGRIVQCFVDRGTGVPMIDSELCRLTQYRFRYRPAYNRNGQAVAGWAGYRQTPPR